MEYIILRKKLILFKKLILEIIVNISYVCLYVPVGGNWPVPMFGSKMANLTGHLHKFSRGRTLMCEYPEGEHSFMSFQRENTHA